VPAPGALERPARSCVPGAQHRLVWRAGRTSVCGDTPSEWLRYCCPEHAARDVQMPVQFKDNPKLHVEVKQGQANYSLLRVLRQLHGPIDAVQAPAKRYRAAGSGGRPWNHIARSVEHSLALLHEDLQVYYDVPVKKMSWPMRRSVEPVAKPHLIDGVRACLPACLRCTPANRGSLCDAAAESERDADWRTGPYLRNAPAQCDCSCDAMHPTHTICA
jgi:hypothetical protein